MRVVYLSILFGALTSLVGCGGEIETVEVAAFRVPCVGFNNQMCLLTKADGETEQTLEYDSIEGFDYEWGQNYELITETHPISNPPQDASSVRVELVEIIKAEPVPAGTEFTISITPFQYTQGYAPHVQRIDEEDDSRWITMDQEPFTCITEDICSTLAAALEGENDAQLTFEFNEDLAIVLQSVVIP